MAITALHSAATGMKAMDTKLDVIANNLANSNTTGFKSSRVNFEDLFYEERRQPGALNSLGQRTSTGLYVGLGTRVSNTQFDLQNGSMEETGQALDLAIRGEGYFKVQSLDGIGGGEAYTRAGNFLIDVEGNLVLGTTDGPIVEFTGSFPLGTDKNSITVTSDGRITGMVDGEEQEIGTLMLYRFPNPHGLRQMGGNLLVESDSSGAATEGDPGESGYGTLVQRFLEASNVDPVRELVSMIRTQRSFELNSKTIQAADENLQVVSRLRR
jgi:flagellar basal-body rod protein FlgG